MFYQQWWTLYRRTFVQSATFCHLQHFSFVSCLILAPHSFSFFLKSIFGVSASKNIFIFSLCVLLRVFKAWETSATVATLLYQSSCPTGWQKEMASQLLATTCDSS
jgi:hypothetical protein